MWIRDHLIEARQRRGRALRTEALDYLKQLFRALLEVLCFRCDQFGLRAAGCGLREDGDAPRKFARGHLQSVGVRLEELSGSALGSAIAKSRGGLIGLLPGLACVIQSECDLRGRIGGVDFPGCVVDATTAGSAQSERKGQRQKRRLPPPRESSAALTGRARPT